MLAAKSLVLDLLGLGAALGLLVLIFQHRALGVAGFLGFHGPSAIETTSAVVIVASAYGLTTDYSVLLLARIVEAHDAEADDRDADAPPGSLGRCRLRPPARRCSLRLRCSPSPHHGCS